MIHETKLVFIYFSILTFIIGLVFGSFLNCVASRYVNYVPIYKGRSKCGSCNTTLKFLDLIPVLSFLLSKGRCRYCGAKISIRYPLSELFCGVAYLLILYKFDLSIKTLVYIVLFSCLFVLSLVDFEIYEIPDTCIVISIIAWIILNIFEGNWLSGVIGGFVLAFVVFIISLIMEKVLRKESLGGGDIKLLFVTGLYLGLICNIFNLILACIIGIIFALGQKRDIIPFGPSISIACMIILLYGSKLIDLYLGLF